MTFAVRVALLCALAVSTLGAGRPDDLQQTLARMRAASGPVWRAHLTSTATLTMNGDSATLENEGFGLRFTTRRCSGALCAGTYFDGHHLFSVDINGTALPRSHAEETFLRAERTIASLAFLDPAFGDDGGRIDPAPDAIVNGKRYHSLIVSNTDAVPMRVYVDPVTYLTRYMRDVNGDTTLEYRNYRRVDRTYVLPFEVLNNGATLETYIVRGAADAKPFSEPHGLTPAVAGQPVSLATDPNFTTPVFACAIAGTPVHCLLDTGNSGLSVSSELAESLHLRSIGQLQVRGLGKYATQVVRTGPLTIGNVTFPNADYIVLNDIHRFGYDVVLGADVLAQSRVEIDPIAHRIAFGVQPLTSAVTVPLAFENFVPVVSVQLGTVEAQLAVDTGDESNINLSYDFYNDHRDLFEATEQHTVSGVGGTSVQFVGKIPQVKIGAYSVGEQRIGATQTLHGTAYGHLGAAFFAHFRVMLDYANGELDLLPTSP